MKVKFSIYVIFALTLSLHNLEVTAGNYSDSSRIAFGYLSLGGGWFDNSGHNAKVSALSWPSELTVGGLYKNYSLSVALNNQSFAYEHDGIVSTPSPYILRGQLLVRAGYQVKFARNLYGIYSISAGNESYYRFNGTDHLSVSYFIWGIHGTLDYFVFNRFAPFYPSIRIQFGYTPPSYINNKGDIRISALYGAIGLGVSIFPKHKD